MVNAKMGVFTIPLCPEKKKKEKERGECIGVKYIILMGEWMEWRLFRKKWGSWMSFHYIRAKRERKGEEAA
jgi:hypothetical protein